MIEFNTILYPSDTYSFYANLNELEDNANFSSWNVSLYHADSLVKEYDSILTLTKDIISGTDYRFYSTFEMPTVANGCYYIIITDTVTNNVLYISNKLEVVSNITDTTFIRYRNDQNILNFNYEGLTTFRNKFRVPIIRRQPLNSLSSEGYDLINGNFKRVRTERVKSLEVVTGFYDDQAHDALQTSLFHSTFEIQHENRWNQYILSDGDYSPNWQEELEVSQATVRLELADRSSTNKGV